MDFETCNFYNFRSALFLILRMNFEVIIVTIEFVIFSMFCTWTGVVLMNSSRSKKVHRSLDHRAKIKAGAINIEISFQLCENYGVRETEFSGNYSNESLYMSICLLYEVALTTRHNDFSLVENIGRFRSWII